MIRIYSKDLSRKRDEDLLRAAGARHTVCTLITFTSLYGRGHENCIEFRMAPTQTAGSSHKRPSTSKFKPPRLSNQSLSASAAVTDERSAASSSTEASASIPPDLLTKLLHEFFEHAETRMSRDANALVAKYMETFVKEAIARAAIERNESNDSSDKFLEVRTICRGGEGWLDGDELDPNQPPTLFLPDGVLLEIFRILR